jgi:glutamate racemase
MYSDGSKCIGVFDSGLGGLTVVRRLMEELPGEELVYLGDSARVPYGTKSAETVRAFAAEDAAFLMRHDPKLIIVACNTASAYALEYLAETFDVPVLGVVAPGAAAAVAIADAGPIGVIATAGTIASGAYPKAIRAIAPEREVLTGSCPLLVPIVEEGRDEDDPIVLAVLSDYLRRLQRQRPSVLILGCTHYPLLAGSIRKLMGPHVRLVDSGEATALAARDLLMERGLAAPAVSGGALRCFATDNPDRFCEVAQRFLGRPVGQVEQVGTDELVGIL